MQYILINNFQLFDFFRQNSQIPHSRLRYIKMETQQAAGYLTLAKIKNYIY